MRVRWSVSGASSGVDVPWQTQSWTSTGPVKPRSVVNSVTAASTMRISGVAGSCLRDGGADASARRRALDASFTGTRPPKPKRFCAGDAGCGAGGCGAAGALVLVPKRFSSIRAVSFCASLDVPRSPCTVSLSFSAIFATYLQMLPQGVWRVVCVQRRDKLLCDGGLVSLSAPCVSHRHVPRPSNPPSCCTRAGSMVVIDTPPHATRMKSTRLGRRYRLPITQCRLWTGQEPQRRECALHAHQRRARHARRRSSGSLALTATRGSTAIVLAWRTLATMPSGTVDRAWQMHRLACRM